MTRRTFLGTAAALAAQPPGRPNLLLIITDQQANQALSFNGNPYLRTPAMDSLAAEGVSFTESYCTYPVCSPARSSIVTSRMPHETDVRVNGRAIASGIPTMGELFRSAGYHTVYGGKWHLPKSFSGVIGFAELIGGNNLGSRMDEPLATACVNFLDTNPRQPFLLVASFMNPHDVCDWIRAHPGSRAHATPAAYPPAPSNMAVDPEEPEYIQYHRTGNYNLMSNAVGIASQWKRDDFRHYLHSYYRLIEDVDRQVGRILSALRSTGLDRNTLVVLTADHGEGMGAHRWVQKAAFWEETAKVPTIVAGPGLGRRGVRDEKALVSQLDILPTFCEAAGVKPPAGIRGRSLLSNPGHPFVVSEISEYGDKSRQGRMLRTPRYKYVVFNGGRRPEQLFDLQLDPGEVSNLAARPGAEAILREHRDRLAAWTAATGDDFRK